MGGAMGGRARPERPGQAVLSLGCEGHEGLPQGCGLRGQRRDRACTVRRFIRVEALLDRSTAVSQEALDETRQCVRRRREGLWGAETHVPPSKEGPQGITSKIRG